MLAYIAWTNFDRVVVFSSGDATIDLKHGVFCIDDPHEGVALYQLHSSTRLLTCKVPVTKSMRARKISFAEDCKVIIGGSDHGIVYVFDRQSGKVVDKLMTDTDDWVQTVTASQTSIQICQLLIWQELGDEGKRDPLYSGGKIAGCCRRKWYIYLGKE